MNRRHILLYVLAAGPLLSASAGAVEPAPLLRIATFQADVTPPLGSPLCHGNVRPAEKIVDRLSSRGIVLLTGGPPIVLCAFDWTGLGNAAHDVCREALSDAVGTSPDRVSVHTVHQHDAPGVDFSTEQILAAHGLSGKMFDVAFARKAIDRVARAAGKAAKEPHRVTHVGCGVAKVDRVASNRRVLGPDGKVKYVRYSKCRIKEAVEAPEGTIDPYVRTLSFWDGDRPLVAISYYACHGQSYYGRGSVSGDLIGMARAAREAALPGVVQIYFAGAGGNVACGKYNDGSPENRPILAGRLEKGMAAAWKATKKSPVNARDVAWHTQPVTLPIRKTMTEQNARKKLEDRANSMKSRVFGARELAWIRRQRSGHQIILSCLRIGPARVLHMPGELFVEYQLAAQQMCPDACVCMAAYGQYGSGYIGTEIAYSQGGYETGYVSRVAPQVEKVLMGAMKKLLEVK